MATRTETRVERYLNKLGKAKRYPVSVACVNFSQDANVGYLARALACFGGSLMHVIGKMPNDVELKKYSGSVCEEGLMGFFDFSTPGEFIKYCKDEGWIIVSAELTEGAVDFGTVKFDKNKGYMIVVGNESDGIPLEILRASDIITYIDMPGYGYCLNTSQTGNIMLYEYAKQMKIED